jgi:hypothetical protein
MQIDFIDRPYELAVHTPVLTLLFAGTHIKTRGIFRRRITEKIPYYGLHRVLDGFERMEAEVGVEPA